MALSSPGIGSGLDINSIVSQLMTAERAPLNLLKKQETSYKSQLSAYGSLKSAISAFQTAVKALTSNNTGLGAQTATVSNTAIMSATAGSKATAGSYAIRVTDLAQPYKITSAGEADITTSLGSGDLTIQVGTGTAVTITPTSHTLQGIRDAINASGAGVSATIINDGTTNGNRLVITAKESGAANTIKVSGTGGMEKFSYNPATPVIFDPSDPTAPMSQLQAGKDAVIEIDGITIRKPSNTITDAIQGVTLNLTQKTEGTTSISLTIARDSAKVKESVNNFIKAYNELHKTVSTMTAYNPETKVAGTLQGDSGAISVLRQVRDTMIKQVTGGGDLTTLNDIGVSFQKDGTLALKDATFDKAIASNFESISKLFTATDGYATKLSALTTELLREDGLIATRTEGLNDTLKSLSKRSESIEQRLVTTEKRLRAQFTALDAALSSMQSTANYMTQQLAVLSKSQG